MDPLAVLRDNAARGELDKIIFSGEDIVGLSRPISFARVTQAVLFVVGFPSRLRNPNADSWDINVRHFGLGHHPITQFLLASSTFLSCHRLHFAENDLEPAAAAAFLLLAMAVSSRKRFAVGSTEDYEETYHLGKGSYGSVVMARHRATGQVVAIKRLGEPGQGQYAVMRETSFLEACSGNPFIVGFHGLVRAPGTMELRLVMECVGPSLGDLFRQRGNNDPPHHESTVRAVMWQLLTGAKNMHRLHIMHRDIKPDNILISVDQGVVKICDFGLALHMYEAPPYNLAGTRWYMAPEMLLGKTDYDALVDSWSLGCVMAELIDGGVLFRGLNTEGQLCAIIDVLGVPNDRTWPWFSSTPFANRLLPQLRYAQRRNLLRERFPETKLSEQGFEVLSGLLTWNPDKRLTASAALKHPWFADLGARKEEDLASALPSKMVPPSGSCNVPKHRIF